VFETWWPYVWNLIEPSLFKMCLSFDVGGHTNASYHILSGCHVTQLRIDVVPCQQQQHRQMSYDFM
jgi:hypothetical protein